MLLSLTTVPTYLQSRGHLSPECWIDGGYSLSPALGQHRNFVICDQSGRGLFLKQIAAAKPDLIASQDNEAAILSAIERLDCWSPQRSAVPRLIDHDRSRHVLLIEYLDGKSFYESYLSVANADDAKRMTERSSTIGRQLASFHRCGRQALQEANHPPMNTTLPVAISMKPPDPNFYAKFSPACRQIMEMIQADDNFLQHLQANQSYWQATTIIHGDLKWDNLVMTDDVEIKFVDWELASVGDPAWDVAGVLQSFLVHEIDQSQSSTATVTMHQQRDAETFWSSYLKHSEQSDDDQFAMKVKRFSAARIIQTAMEREFHSDALSPVSAQLIMASQSILSQRHDGASAGSLSLRP